MAILFSRFLDILWSLLHTEKILYMLSNLTAPEDRQPIISYRLVIQNLNGVVTLHSTIILIIQVMREPHS